MHIFMGKTGRKNRSNSAEFKMSVITDIREHGLGYRDTIRKYIAHFQENYFAFLNIFLEEGGEASLVLPVVLGWIQRLKKSYCKGQASSRGAYNT